MLNIVYDWAATLSNAFLVALLCTIGFRFAPSGHTRFLQRNLLRLDLGILFVGELALLAGALWYGPRPVSSSIVTEFASPVSLLISAATLTELVKSWLQRHRRGGRRWPDDFNGGSGSGVHSPMGPPPLVLAGRDAMPWPPAAE